MPPDDIMEVISVQSDGETDTVRFLWSQSGSGTMTMRWDDRLLAELVVAFDES
jgi:hypothetical protein